MFPAEHTQGKQKHQNQLISSCRMKYIKSVGYTVAQERTYFGLGKKDMGTWDFNSILSEISCFMTFTVPLVNSQPALPQKLSK